jgi:Flp pilus assembly protein TadG
MVRFRFQSLELRRGAAAVELAIVLPLIMFAFLAGGDWCRIFYAASTVEDSARTGALAASGIAYMERDLTPAQRVTRGKYEAALSATNLNPPLSSGNITVNVSGGFVDVTVDYTFQSITSFPLVGGSYPLSRTVRMPILP